ncbi:hypothetical protein V5F77_29255, partial [Xanthobacter sp. DSM 24535]|uniref:hypothetical protein n=1 Tax=Roseixanthobacter psychrophilus TaxID=3119917 RepID=UPI00372A239C
ANIHFAARELRVVRFDVVFQPIATSFAPSAASTLGAVLTGVTALLAAAQGQIGAVLGLGTIGVATWAAAVETAGAVGTVVGAAALASPAAA